MSTLHCVFSEYFGLCDSSLSAPHIDNEHDNEKNICVQTEALSSVSKNSPSLSFPQTSCFPIFVNAERGTAQIESDWDSHSLQSKTLPTSLRSSLESFPLQQTYSTHPLHSYTPKSFENTAYKSHYNSERNNQSQSLALSSASSSSSSSAAIGAPDPFMSYSTSGIGAGTGSPMLGLSPATVLPFNDFLSKPLSVTQHFSRKRKEIEIEKQHEIEETSAPQQRIHAQEWKHHEQQLKEEVEKENENENDEKDNVEEDDEEDESRIIPDGAFARSSVAPLQLSVAQTQTQLPRVHNHWPVGSMFSDRRRTFVISYIGTMQVNDINQVDESNVQYEQLSTCVEYTAPDADSSSATCSSWCNVVRRHCLSSDNCMPIGLRIGKDEPFRCHFCIIEQRPTLTHIELSQPNSPVTLNTTPKLLFEKGSTYQTQRHRFVTQISALKKAFPSKRRPLSEANVVTNLQEPSANALSQSFPHCHSVSNCQCFLRLIELPSYDRRNHRASKDLCKSMKARIDSAAAASNRHNKRANRRKALTNDAACTNFSESGTQHGSL